MLFRSDRIYAEWWLRSRRVEEILSGESTLPPTITAQVDVPALVYQWKQDADQRMLASDLQTRNRIALQTAFGSGLAVLDYKRDAEGNGTFLLGPLPEGPWTERSIADTSHPSDLRTPFGVADSFQGQESAHD